MSLDGNHLSQGACYANADARDMALVSILRVAHKLFASASIIQSLDQLCALRERHFPLEEVHSLFASLDPPYLDAFKLATSFENLFKAELLSFGYVVHKVDKRVNGRQYEVLARTQSVGPVRIRDIRAAEGTSWRRRGPFTISSLTKETLTLGTLIDLNLGYRRSLRLSSQLVAALQYVRAQRNTVHFVVNDIGRFNEQVVDWYVCLKSAINGRLIPRYRNVIAKYPHLRGNPNWGLDEI